VTQGRVEYESTIPRGKEEGMDLWEADPGIYRSVMNDTIMYENFTFSNI
jgi:hypothetical protein